MKRWQKVLCAFLGIAILIVPAYISLYTQQGVTFDDRFYSFVKEQEGLKEYARGDLRIFLGQQPRGPRVVFRGPDQSLYDFKLYTTYKNEREVYRNDQLIFKGIMGMDGGGTFIGSREVMAETPPLPFNTGVNIVNITDLLMGYGVGHRGDTSLMIVACAIWALLILDVSKPKFFRAIARGPKADVDTMQKLTDQVSPIENAGMATGFLLQRVAMTMFHNPTDVEVNTLGQKISWVLFGFLALFTMYSSLHF